MFKAQKGSKDIVKIEATRILFERKENKNDFIQQFLLFHCCLCRVRKLSDIIKNILICVSKINESLTGLERHEAE